MSRSYCSPAKHLFLSVSIPGDASHSTQSFLASSERNGLNVHAGQQFAKARASKLYIIVSAPRKETSVYRAVIYNQIIIKCQLKLFKLL